MKQPKATDKSMPADFFSFDPTNARRHPEKQLDLIARSIRRFGFVSRLICRPDGQLIGGEATLIAAKRVGMEQIPCTVVEGLDETQYKALALALNKLPENSAWDAEQLAETVAELVAAGEDVRLIGFSEKELQALTVDPAELEVYEITEENVADEFWIAIRGPLEHQADALQALEAAIGKLPNVSVELGTIAI